MIATTVNELCAAVGGTVLQSTDAAVTTVCTDSRGVPVGSLFIPLVGERFDGHDYLTAALSAGAAGCFCSRTPEELLSDKFYIRVDDTQLALKALASWYRGRFTLPMIQITGSVGKTTTKEMIASVLAQHYFVLKTDANYNNEIGTPQTLLGLTPAHQAAVIETGMNHFDEICYLGEMVRPSIAVISNIGDAHIENLGGTRQGTLRAKSEIFDNLQPGGLAVLNGDDELLSTLHLPFRTVRCGRSEGCDVRVTEVRDRGIDGVTATVTTARDTYQAVIPAPGVHMIYSAAMAIAIGEELGLKKEEMLRGVAGYKPTGSRMHNIVRTGNRRILDDCYNANPQSMRAALEILARTDCAKKVAVLGDMGELGALAATAHYEMGKLAADLGIDQVVAIGEKSARLADGARENGLRNTNWFENKEAAMETIQRAFVPGSVVLVKASHAMEFGKIVRALEGKND
ncbi:MAG: UDP-N-acetylmuramoyl-tripeptide--D-alanyl-D-alanine ligase [Oscillibacter sp.]|nr:UDP-N-acetylmuramoyl-tripeptide--D-alanyl-D-alanine ligase [Oscillibacter sp.]